MWRIQLYCLFQYRSPFLTDFVTCSFVVTFCNLANWFLLHKKHTMQLQYSQCSINFQCFNYHSHSCISNTVVCSCYIQHSILIYILFNFTTQIQFSECSIGLQCFTYHSCSFYSNIVRCSYLNFIMFIFLIYLSFSYHHHSDLV